MSPPQAHVLQSEIQCIADPFCDTEYTLYHLRNDDDYRFLTQHLFNVDQYEYQDYTAFGPGWYMLYYDPEYKYYTLSNLESYITAQEEKLSEWTRDVRSLLHTKNIIEE